jgi:hypothetical protein
MIQSKQPLAQSIIQLCKSHNIKHIVISPGSRNAPLTIGFTNHDFFECYSIVDERSAGFLHWVWHSNYNNLSPWYVLLEVPSLIIILRLPKRFTAGFRLL